ncbi:MAG: tRNA (adenosine(37)-N6)-threonylcarbamoyltransferase complex dimerization subunit type 1 TsaB [Actinomycetota bacterium]|nr:tRNA (adenosine(37)-N6)-threonylcarbamoyltransferase complex dimerization subunit type 1 TsaB [Actinomycetota bacterium]
MLTLGLDTATDVATVALVRDGAVLGERDSRALRILADAGTLLADAGLEPAALDAVVAGTGPGSYTGLRMGLATARALALSLAIPATGISTLAALASGADGAVPVVDARRGEVFTEEGGVLLVVLPDDLGVERGRTYVGDGAVRYRAAIAGRGGLVPPDESPLHVPWARHHVALAREYGFSSALEPIYLRVPDAERRRVAGGLRV